MFTLWHGQIIAPVGAWVLFHSHRCRRVYRHATLCESGIRTPRYLDQYLQPFERQP